MRANALCLAYFVAAIALLAACGTGGTTGGSGTAPPASPSARWWVPAPGSSFQYDLSQAGLPSPGASIEDIDWEATTASEVATLHAAGAHAVCYVDAGSYENWRPDAASFPAVVLGNTYAGYPNERWLDIRRIDLLAPIMDARIATCQAKGFDGVEFDNVDGYDNNTGFPLTLQDDETYLANLAAFAHANGLAVGLKNAPEMLPAMASTVDFAINESCWAQGWCAQDAPLRAQHKFIVDVEYDDVTSAAQFTSAFCPAAAALGDTTILKHPTLDAWILTCP
ncbi:MAG: endo alpha-1,4 polygalactosaminidase [Candidatus Eremiobacteraeota bacterium]|nr:endo alpha-1,4 polygalactosaminidase [Candidatus Eremiobacteraeota bacterium]NNM93741.1 endo alpha-1,4 polygalactosaminidase [Candidatus Eremiobacteraeota bacterium]